MTEAGIASGIAYGQGVALSACEREIRELREQVANLSEMVSDLIIEVEIMKAMQGDTE